MRVAVFYWAFVALRDGSGTATGKGCPPSRHSNAGLDRVMDP
jgi:hypothetical protein